MYKHWYQWTRKKKHHFVTGTIHFWVRHQLDYKVKVQGTIQASRCIIALTYLFGRQTPPTFSNLGTNHIRPRTKPWISHHQQSFCKMMFFFPNLICSPFMFLGGGHTNMYLSISTYTFICIYTNTIMYTNEYSCHQFQVTLDTFKPKWPRKGAA